MPKSIGRLWLATLVGVLASNVALGGPLPTDGATSLATQGSVIFSGTDAGAQDTFTARVEYAVYAPGEFSTSVALGLPADFSGGTEYIYAYELFNIGGGANDRTLAALSVGLFAGGVANNATLVSHLPGTPEGGIAPVNSRFNPVAVGPKTNVIWTFNQAVGPNDLAIGEHSDILIFASPNPPVWKTSSITGVGGAAGSEFLPTPIPEPATYALAAIGALCLLAAKSFRRRLS